MPDEIDLNEEEEAALDRAWARIWAENAAKKRQQEEQGAGKGKGEDEETEQEA